MSADACRVCGNQTGNKLHHAREMLMGRRDPFVYVECGACGTLQIRDVPDLRPYYGANYYSFQPLGRYLAARACWSASPNTLRTLRSTCV